jgi:pilus assembly protein FimV
LDKLKLYSAVEKLIQKGQIDKAIQGLEQILKADPVDMKALNRAADLYLKEGSTDKAVDSLKRIGAAYSKDGFYSKAVAIYKRILKIDGVVKEELMAVHHQLATLYGQLGLVSDAMGHFSIVVDYYDQTGNQAALLEVLRKVSDLDPTNVESQLKMIELALSQKQDSEAEESLDRLLEHVQTRKSAADLIRVLERSIELFPKNTKRLQDLVDAYVSVNEPKKALAKIQASFRADPRNPVVLEMLSSTFLALKQPDKSKAVDVELVKLYRQSGEDDKAKVVESRIKGQTFEKTNTANPNEAPKSEEIRDPVESLIKALPLTADEKKVISECEVYFKYGLVDKAYEVLKSRLEKFPQSLILRWKLKNCTHELKKKDETAHVLSEIILLAKSQNLEIWSNLAATELQAIDPKHPSLQSKEKPVVKSRAKEEKETVPVNPLEEELDEKLKAAVAEEFADSAEVSIVIDDEVSNESDFSEISLQDLNDTGPVKIEDSTIDLAEEAARISDVSVKPAKAAAETISKSSEENPIEIDLEGESILSESDFTSDELSQLGINLASETSDVVQRTEPAPTAMVQAAKKNSTKPAPPKTPSAKKQEEISTPPIDLGLFADEKSDPGKDGDFEIRQGIEEIDFFRSQGLEDEASALLLNLRARFPKYSKWDDLERVDKAPSANGQHRTSKARNRSLEVETLGRKVKMSVQEDLRSESDDQFVDLAGELLGEMSEPVGLEQNSPPEIKEVFAAFKKGVAATIDEGDWQTHFDLGVAYREMGLNEDAIEEFKIVSRASGQKIAGLYQIGLTKMSMELYGEAKEVFDKALKEPEVAVQEKLSVSYELAEALLKLNDKAKAKKLFEEVRKVDPEFREVQEKIKAIG